MPLICMRNRRSCPASGMAAQNLFEAGGQSPPRGVRCVVSACVDNRQWPSVVYQRLGRPGTTCSVSASLRQPRRTTNTGAPLHRSARRCTCRTRRCTQNASHNFQWAQVLASRIKLETKLEGSSCHFAHCLATTWVTFRMRASRGCRMARPPSPAAANNSALSPDSSCNLAVRLLYTRTKRDGSAERPTPPTRHHLGATLVLKPLPCRSQSLALADRRPSRRATQFTQRHNCSKEKEHIGAMKGGRGEGHPRRCADPLRRGPIIHVKLAIRYGEMPLFAACAMCSGMLVLESRGKSNKVGERLGHTISHKLAVEASQFFARACVITHAASSSLWNPRCQTMRRMRLIWNTSNS